MAQASPASPQAVARVLGGGLATASAAAAAGAAPAISRYVLAGVVAGSFRTGAALISVDGRAAKPVRVGSLVDDGVMLQSVTARSAVLSSGDGASANFTLELPSLDN